MTSSTNATKKCGVRCSMKHSHHACLLPMHFLLGAGIAVGFLTHFTCACHKDKVTSIPLTSDGAQSGSKQLTAKCSGQQATKDTA